MNTNTSRSINFTALSTLLLASSCVFQSGPAVLTTVTTGTQFAVTGNTDSLFIDMQGILWQLPPTGGPARALSDASDDIRRPQVSPNGDWLAAQSFASGSWNIEVMRTDGSERRDITQSSYDDREPAWSDDGKTILFTSDRSGNEDIWSANVATGETTQLTTNTADDYLPAATSTGFLFVSGRNGQIALYRQTSNAEIELLALAPAGTLHGARVSPDDNYTAWVQAKQRNGFPAIAINQLIILNNQTRTFEIVSQPGSDVFAMPPTWINANTLIYTADGSIRQFNIQQRSTKTLRFSAPLSLTRNKFVPKKPLALTQSKTPARGIVDPVALADNSMVFTALGDLWQQLPTGELQQITDDAWVERDVSASQTSPDIAYISDRGGSMQIWLHNLSTDLRRQLTKSSAGPRYPTFAPDGKKLAYQQVGPIGTQDFTVHVLDLDTGESTRLRSAPRIWPGRMSWSADSQNITVAELARTSTRLSDGRNRLVTINIETDSSRIANLTAELSPDAGPVASPDGKQLALVFDGALWTAPIAADGSINGLPELRLDELVESPAWHADNQHISILTSNGLETVNISTGERANRQPDIRWEPASGKNKKIIHARRLFTGMEDEYQRDVDITIDDAKIASVKEHSPHPPNIQVIDAGNQTVLPGLIDHHTHYEPHKGEWVGRALLAFGVTTVVEPGGLPYESREHLEAWASGKRLGPRLIFAGPQLDGARRTFYFASHINSERRLKWELERAQWLDYSFIKTYRRMRPELQRKTIQLAHAQGLSVTAHAGLRNLGSGGDRTEHLRGSSRITSADKQSDLLHSYADNNAIYSVTNTALTPTLVNQGGFFDFALSTDLLASNAQYNALYSPAYRQNLQGFVRFVGRNIELIRKGLSNAQKTLYVLNKNGVNIVAGTDSPIFPHGLALVIELQTYVDAGLTPAEALHTATRNAAVALGAKNEIGTIQRGALADILIVDGDPLENITDLLNVRQVIKNGQVFKVSELLNAQQ